MSGPLAVRPIRVFGAEASPCASTGSSIGGRGPSEAGPLRPRIPSMTHLATTAFGTSSSAPHAPLAARARSRGSPQIAGPATCRRRRSHRGSPPSPAIDIVVRPKETTVGTGCRCAIESSRSRSCWRSIPELRGSIDELSANRNVSPPDSLRHADSTARPRRKFHDHVGERGRPRDGGSRPVGEVVVGHQSEYGAGRHRSGVGWRRRRELNPGTRLCRPLHEPLCHVAEALRGYRRCRPITGRFRDPLRTTGRVGAALPRSSRSAPSPGRARRAGGRTNGRSPTARRGTG